MPEKTHKPYTLRDVAFTDIDLFVDIKEKNRLTPGGCLGLLISTYLNQEKNNGNTENNQALKDQIDSLQQQLQKATALNESQAIQIASLESTQPQTITKTIEVSPKQPAFIFDPSNYEGLKKLMERSIAYQIKKGNLNKTATDLPAQFTAHAIHYYIKNEFNHIQK